MADLRELIAGFVDALKGDAQDIGGRALDVAKIPGDVYQGSIPYSNLPLAAREFANSMAGGGLAVGSAPQGALGIFAGRRAKTANLEALNDAKQYAANGVDRDRIWVNTGWFQGTDGEWRFEIPDRKATLGKLPINEFGAGDTISLPLFDEIPLSKVINHPELFKAYPELANIPVKSTGFNFGVKGSVNEDYSAMRLAGGDPRDVRSTALHEIQHLIQGREGFAEGGSPGQFIGKEGLEAAKELKGILSKYEDEVTKVSNKEISPYVVRDAIRAQEAGKPLYKYQQEALEKLKATMNPQFHNEYISLLRKYAPMMEAEDRAYKSYKNLAGEVEARNVQARGMRQEDVYAAKARYPSLNRDLKAADLRYPPYRTVEEGGTMDVPEIEQIVLGVGGRPLAVKRIEHDPFAGSSR